jgi:pseudouridine synthase
MLGVEITTPIQRDNSEEKLITAKTLPCYVKRIKSNINTQQDSSSSTSTSYSRKVEFTLIEGRNRQIRRMAEAVGLEVVALHRISFAGIRLKGLSQGNWCELSGSEMKIVQEALLQNKSKSGQREAQ